MPSCFVYYGIYLKTFLMDFKFKSSIISLQYKKEGYSLATLTVHSAAPLFQSGVYLTNGLVVTCKPLLWLKADKSLYPKIKGAKPLAVLIIKVFPNNALPFLLMVNKSSSSKFSDFPFALLPHLHIAANIILTDCD